MSTLYILQLEDGKWYIGKTDNIQKRFEQHKNGYGSAWTRLYKPIKISETRPIISIHDENNVTKDCMKIYGIDNVRGGSYTQEELEEYQYECLKYEIRCISDCCFKCGRSGHFSKNCMEDLDHDEEVFWECEKCKEQFETESDCEKHEKTCSKKNIKCTRCGRNNHTISNCFARTHINGYQITT